MQDLVPKLWQDRKCFKAQTRGHFTLNQKKSFFSDFTLVVRVPFQRVFKILIAKEVNLGGLSHIIHKADKRGDPPWLAIQVQTSSKV